MTLATIIIDVDPTAFHVGGIAVHWYGIMYVVAIAIAARVCLALADRFGADVDQLWAFFPWAIAAGFLGGRLFYVAQNRQGYYLTHPGQILAFWEGGMAFFGAIILVSLTAVIFIWRNRIPALPVLDMCAIFAAVGQPFGRIGNIINGDIVGYKTDLPWGTAYTNPHSLAPALGVAYQPAAVYEILANILLLAVLWLVLRRRRVPGLAGCIYLIGYSVTQFVVFFWRANSITALGLKQAQLSSIVAFAVGLVLLWWVLNRRKEPEPTPTPEPATVS